MKREAEQTAKREQQAWELARQAANVLKERFMATRVVVFGSLVHRGMFTQWSDVDLAVWGLRPEETFKAIGAVMEVGGSQLPLNLVDVTACRSSLRQVIEKEGIDL
jgi:predicted nucleotidyltransferase